MIFGNRDMVIAIYTDYKTVTFT